jgi:uncharacterized alkaline shock family protein YloU
MAGVSYNAPQYGYGSAVPQPPMPQAVPDDDEPEVRSYDMDPAYEHGAPEHAPPALVNVAPSDDSDASGGAVSGSGSGASSDAVEQPAAPVTPAAPPSSAPSGRVAVQVVDRLRGTAERGTTTVPPEVIEKIATRQIRDVPGVYRFGGDPGGTGPISINLDGRTATVELRLVIEYGFAVYSVTEKVRMKVISELENLFSLDVTSVDIMIDDIHVEPEESSPDT